MKELGGFSFKVTSLTFSAGPNDSVMIHVNCEGKAPGGTVALTLECTPGKSGPYNTYGTNYLDNGDVLTTKGTGTFESSGKYRWRTQADVTRFDGLTLHSRDHVFGIRSASTDAPST